jgi:hypothetical protein
MRSLGPWSGRVITALCLATSGCGGDSGDSTSTTATTADTGLSAGVTDGSGSSDDGESGADGGRLDQMASTGDGDGDGDTGECATVSEQAENEFAPVDILFVVDNSGSMDAEESFVQSQMNTLSNLISSLSIDVQLILVSNYNICIPPPLGGGGCPNDDNNPPAYTHINQGVGSNDALEIITDNTGVVSQFDALMRDNSVKHVVVVSDDDSDKSASAFDADFQALGAKYQGYKFHAIVASALPAFAPCLFLSAARGQEYIDLVGLTGGVYGDLCLQEFGPVFVEIATSVQQTTPLACEWDIPPPPDGQMFDPNKVNVQLTLDTVPEDVFWVPSEANCMGGDGWYYFPDNVNPTQIRICPATCTRVQAAGAANVDILFGCDTIPVD